MEEFAKKNGLIYTTDFKCVLGIDSYSSEFTGTVPNGAERIEEEAFSCCNIKDISFPDSVVSVGANLFCNSDKLESVKLSKNLKNLSPYMFCGCSALKKIEMPYEINDFPEGLFAGCSSLLEIPFRAGIKTLPDGVFDGCSSITSLVIPDSVTRICSGSIKNCDKLRSIVLPTNLEVFEPDSITSCSNLSHIRISDENDLFSTNEEGSCLLKKNDDDSKSIVFEIPNRVLNDVPDFIEPDELKNPSILCFSDDEDEEDSDFIDETDSPEETESIEKSDSSIADKLAEIMGQEKQYGSADFSISDIPEASEEEIKADCLVSKNTEEKEPTDERNVIDEETSIQEDKLETEEKVSKLDIKSFMDKIVFESKKIEQQVVDSDCDEQKILYVFAEDLCINSVGKYFSEHLKICCNKLAKIHACSSIFYFYEVNLDNEQFNSELTEFMKDKDVLIACESSSLCGISEKVKKIASCTGVILCKDEILKQAENAGKSNSECLKLIIKDIIE